MTITPGQIRAYRSSLDFTPRIYVILGRTTHQNWWRVLFLGDTNHITDWKTEWATADPVLFTVPVLEEGHRESAREHPHP